VRLVESTHRSARRSRWWADRRCAQADPGPRAACPRTAGSALSRRLPTCMPWVGSRPRSSGRQPSGRRAAPMDSSRDARNLAPRKQSSRSDASLETVRRRTKSLSERSSSLSSCPSASIHDGLPARRRFLGPARLGRRVRHRGQRACVQAKPPGDETPARRRTVALPVCCTGLRASASLQRPSSFGQQLAA